MFIFAINILCYSPKIGKSAFIFSWVKKMHYLCSRFLVNTLEYVDKTNPFSSFCGAFGVLAPNG